MKAYVTFNTGEKTTLNQVGGKAMSLIKMTAGGFNVPSGCALTVGFFEPWLSQLRDLAIFKDLHKQPDRFAELDQALKSHGQTLAFTEDQKKVVNDILTHHLTKGDRFAVRSSSPEEDLTGASFAGGYETLLGVPRDQVQDAVKQAFLSCLDQRVFYYKYEKGFAMDQLRIAVIIQTQIASEVSGVGFSINPLNNCFDEVVVNGNFGLGESVVSGIITPDEFVVDKNTLEILDQQIGSKEEAIHMAAGGGVESKTTKTEDLCLTPDQVKTLAQEVGKIETFYGFPVDVEWAFAGGQLYILQARPITAYVPLPTVMQTKPGEKRILYLDGSLTKQGITEPISVLGCDNIQVTQERLATAMMGKNVMADVKGGLATTTGGRMFMNLSTSLKFQGEDRFKNTWKTVDTGTVDLMDHLDLSPYKMDKLPATMKGALWGAIVKNLSAIGRVMKASKDPRGYKEWYQPFEDNFDLYLKEISGSRQDISQVADEIYMKYLDLMLVMVPFTYTAELARKKLAKLLNKHLDNGEEVMQYLERSLPDNVTINMGLMMYDLSQFPEMATGSYEDLMDKVDKDQVSSAFAQAWESYIEIYGCRANNEMDIAVDRPNEDGRLAFDQIKGMTMVEAAYRPRAIHEASVKAREEAYRDCLDRLPPGKHKAFVKNYTALVELGGKREALKYWFIRSIDAVRKCVLSLAGDAHQLGILDDPKDVFWLHMSDLDQLLNLSRDQVYARMEADKAYYGLLDQVHQFPKLMDSRGKILRMPPREAKPGELTGQAISPGLVRGRAKVLRTPDEKPLLPGEILVTRATDPGWTRLFINASAILLEVGGLLQHGALVAREYGKPCVAGIDNIMDQIEDGQVLEVDAAAGIVRIIASEALDQPVESGL